MSIREFFDLVIDDSPVAILRLTSSAEGYLLAPEHAWIRMWEFLESRPQIFSVAATMRPRLAHGAKFSPVGPKDAGMIKPFVLGVDGLIDGGVYELLFQADGAIATSNSTVGAPEPFTPSLNMNRIRGLPAFELNRLALLGKQGGMAIERALQLGLVDRIADSQDLERVTIERALHFADRTKRPNTDSHNHRPGTGG
jgi:enoyl-CoA hydratase/carnithine racemase